MSARRDNLTLVKRVNENRPFKLEMAEEEKTTE